MYKEYLKNNNDIFFLSLYRINGWGGREVEIIIYLLTGYEGIASLFQNFHKICSHHVHLC
jgi:ABC-type uncharacterized transport system permease subunit